MSTTETGGLHRPGKSWDFCPTRLLLADRLIEGKVQAEDAIFLWDFGYEGGRTIYINIEVGLNPVRTFKRLGASESDKEAWSVWRSQWQNNFGGGEGNWMLSIDDTNFVPELGFWSNTPERVVAGWLARGKIPVADRAALMARLASRIHGFSSAHVEELEKEHMAATGAPLA